MSWSFPAHHQSRYVLDSVADHKAMMRVPVIPPSFHGSRPYKQVQITASTVNWTHLHWKGRHTLKDPVTWSYHLDVFIVVPGGKGPQISFPIVIAAIPLELYTPRNDWVPVTLNANQPLLSYESLYTSVPRDILGTIGDQLMFSPGVQMDIICYLRRSGEYLHPRSKFTPHYVLYKPRATSNQNNLSHELIHPPK